MAAAATLTVPISLGRALAASAIALTAFNTPGEFVQVGDEAFVIVNESLLTAGNCRYQ